jgi:hypothetical protein
MLESPRDRFQTALSVFMQGSSDIAHRSAGEHQDSLFLCDLGFAL